MCNFCSDIKELQEYKNLSWWDKDSCIVYDANYNVYGYWVECGDTYYRRYILQWIRTYY